MFEGFFDATLGKLFLIPDLWQFPTGLFVVSLILTGLITIIYKYTTNQERLKELKKEVKDLQKDRKLLKGDQQKLMELNKIFRCGCRIYPCQSGHFPDMKPPICIFKKMHQK